MRIPDHNARAGGHRRGANINGGRAYRPPTPRPSAVTLTGPLGQRLSARPTAPPGRTTKPKLLDQMRLALRSRHYSRRTEQTYVMWVKRFIFFHGKRHPADMTEPEINAFLTHLAVKEKVSASTQTQALSAILFLYRHVIRREVGDLGEVI